MSELSPSQSIFFMVLLLLVLGVLDQFFGYPLALAISRILGFLFYSWRF